SLLEKYGTLDSIYEHLDEVAKGARTRLEANRDNAYLSRKLAEIITDLKVTLHLDAARVRLDDLSEVESLFHELEFRSLQKRLRDLPQVHAGLEPVDPVAVVTAAAAGGQLPLFGAEGQMDLGRVGLSPAYE